MDEHDSPQNRSNDDAELSKSFDENSIIGKMKVGVSRILPNSLSKWLSPKVDVTNARRRRHEEIDSDDDGGVRGNFPATIATTDSRYQTTPQLSAPPPNKKKKTFTDFLNRHTYDLYSPNTPSIGERSNIVSSTLIEDVPHSRTVNQFNRYSTLENGQHSSTAAAISAAATNAYADESARENDRYNNDEASSSQSHDKPTNLFTINNDSSVVNFSAHLQRAKSLFTNRSYISPRLKNYRMRNPRSSLYRSTSSLCDNNSVSSNASSAMSSPFYNGQTTFGGASATSRRMSAATTTDIQMHLRPKVPTNLVTSRSTSSLNTIGGTTGSASMSTTAKRILDVMNKYNTPLTEVRRISNALPSIAETTAINKRKTILELESTTNDIDRSKRTLLNSNTPYNRPFGRNLNPAESVLTTELQVPSMPELLQLKKFATNTMKIRDIANKTDNILNRPVSSVAPEFKLSTVSKATVTKTKIGSGTNNRATTDLDASNNNKFVNNKNDTISTKLTSVNDVNREHRNKIRNNLNKRNLGKRAANEDAMPEPVNLPNISLVFDKKAELKFSEPLKFSNAIDQKIASGNRASDNGLQIPFKFKSSNTNAVFAPAVSATGATKESKRTNGNSSENLKKLDMSPTKLAMSTSLFPSSTATATASFNARTNADIVDKSQPLRNNSRETTIYRFSEPIIVKTSSPNSFKQHNNFGGDTTNYIFSEPIYVTDDKSNDLLKSESAKTFGNFKYDSKQIKGVPSDSGIGVDATQSSFGSNFSKSTVRPTQTTSTTSDFGKSVSSINTQPKEDDTFKSLVAKQKEGKWECKDCYASNESAVNKCVCCGSANQKDGKTVINELCKPVAPVDDVFKSILAKQKQSKWECKDCLAQNDETESKCLCCGGANPNAPSSNVTDIKAVPPKPTFSFGAFPSASTSDTSAASNQPIDSVFKSIVDKQQKNTWKCSACLNANDASKSKCECCEQSRDVTKAATTSGTVPAKSQLSFGSSSTFAPAKSGFSFGSNADTVESATSTFSFGNLAAVKTNPSAQLTFGNVKNSESVATTTATTNNLINDGKTETEKAKDSSIQKAPASSSSTQFSFGNSAVLPSTSKIETVTPRLESNTTDSIFKSIVDKQKSSSWECSSCMAKNLNDVVKCVCCGTSKDGSAPKDQAKKEFSLETSKKFVFGSPSGSSNSTINFGSKPENKSSFQFGTSSSSTSTTTTSSLSSTTTASPIAAPSTTNVFGSSQQASTFSFIKPTTTTESTSSSQSASALSGFKFGFGSPSVFAPIFGAKEVSNDETDTGKGVTVLENVLVKQAATANGPTEASSAPKPFVLGHSFGNQTPTIDDPIAKAQKRPNTDSSDTNVVNKFPAITSALTSTPFVFGQTQNTNTTNTFSAITSNPTTNQVSSTTQTSTPTTQKNPTFAFGTSQSTNAFPTVQPTFSFNATSNLTTSSAAATPSPFGASSTASNPIFGSGNALPAQSTPPNTAQPVFGSNIFAQPATTQPTLGLGGFKVGNTFGSSTTASGTTSMNATAQPPASSSPAPSGLFQFGASNINQSAQSEPPKVGGFNFSKSTQPTFNFSEQNTQQSNVPFQFGAPTDAPNMFSAQPSANTTAIQQRRKIRSIRRVNRPSTQF